MLNRNFKTMMLGWFMSSQVTDNNDPIFKSHTIYEVDGESRDYPSNPDYSTEMTRTIINALNQLTTTNTIATQSQQRLFIAVGTGTTEATEEDYTLETENTDIICEAITHTYTPSYKRQITATFNNPTPQDINLKEVGLFYETRYDNANFINTIMLARENIDVTIPAGESKAITMEIG